MKKILLLFICTIQFFVFTSCEENFSPKTDFQEKYVLYSVVSANIFDKPITVDAVIAQTYDVDGYDPYTNTEDPNIQGAVVTLSLKNKSFVLDQKSIRRIDSTRYNGRFYYYSKSDDNLIFRSGEKITIEAVLPNGVRLSSVAYVPYSMSLEFSYDFSAIGVTPNVNRFAVGDAWEVSWEVFEGDHLYFPSMTIQYTKLIDGVEESFSKRIPNKYITVDGKSVPFYEDYTYDYKTAFDYSAIERAFIDISEGDSVKSNYRIQSVNFNITDYDPGLAKYYASSHGSLDQYSIRLDESLFTNINGGLGVFGISKSNSRSYEVNFSFAQDLGYKR